jgi:hypothetical protein
MLYKKTPIDKLQYPWMFKAPAAQMQKRNARVRLIFYFSSGFPHPVTIDDCYQE